MTAIALTPSSPGPNVDTDRLVPHPRRALNVVARRTATALVAAIVVTTAWTHRHQLGAGFHLLNYLCWWWLPAALLLEGASLATYAELQTRLLRAGHVDISASPVTKISVAANAMSASLPGGVAWSIPWSWKQLRNRGADRRLATWVVLVAGALSYFALFVMVVAGAELAGDHGPVPSLRWWARALAVIAAAGGLLLVVIRRRRRRHAPSGSRLAKLYDQTRVARLSSGQWAAALTLASARRLASRPRLPDRLSCRGRCADRLARHCRRLRPDPTDPRLTVHPRRPGCRRSQPDRAPGQLRNTRPVGYRHRRALPGNHVLGSRSRRLGRVVAAGQRTL